MGFSRQEYWSRLPRPPPGDLPHPGIEPTSMSLALAGRFFTASATWDAYIYICVCILMFVYYTHIYGGSAVKNSPANARDSGLIPGSGNGNLLQYSFLGNPMDREAWQAIDHGVAKSPTGFSN